MDDLISRTEFLKGFSYHAPEERFSPDEEIYLLNKAPTVAATPVRHGDWVGKHKSTCSECGDVNLRAFVGPTPLYCQVCGARMDAKEDANG
jgi:hypothetical protein